MPERYAVADERVRALVADGFEVGVHGLRHDGRDLESLATLEKRLPAMRAWAERWGAVGFRSPATHRGWDLIPLLGFDYDSSYPDTDPFEPQARRLLQLAALLQPRHRRAADHPAAGSRRACGPAAA